MLESKNIYIFGYSGHSYVVIDILLSLNYNIKGYFDKNESLNNPYNINYLGFENEVSVTEIVKEDYVFPSIGSNRVRKTLANLFESKNLNQLTITHSNAQVSLKAQIGVSSLIAANVVVNSMASIGENCIINTGAIIEHECEIGDFSHIAPGAVLAGRVVIGNNCFIGAGTVIKNGIVIGNNVTVGAGAVVVKNIPDNETWVGNPAKKIKE